MDKDSEQIVEEFGEKLKNTKINVGAGGPGFFGLLFIAFLVLKLTNVINWSWWWITAPLWGPFAVVVGGISLVVVGAIIVAFIYELCTSRKK